MNEFIPLIVGLVALGTGVLLGYFARQTIAKKQEGTVEARISKLLDNAKSEAQSLLLQARKKSVQVLEEAKKEEQERKRQVARLEQRVIKKEETLEKREGGFLAKEQELQQKIEQVRLVKENAEELRAKRLKDLENIAQLTKANAKVELFSELENECKTELHE